MRERRGEVAKMLVEELKYFLQATPAGIKT
jgi:hypothetical protein